MPNSDVHVCGVTRSILGQPWRWRGRAADAGDPGFQPDDLVDQLLLARGVTREDLARHRRPTLRDFMPDPSVFAAPRSVSRRKMCHLVCTCFHKAWACSRALDVVATG